MHFPVVPPVDNLAAIDKEKDVAAVLDQPGSVHGGRSLGYALRACLHQFETAVFTEVSQFTRWIFRVIGVVRDVVAIGTTFRISAECAVTGWKRGVEYIFPIYSRCSEEDNQ